MINIAAPVRLGGSWVIPSIGVRLQTFEQLNQRKHGTEN